jgi:hypothetical protein
MPATDGRVNSGNRAKAFDLSVRGDALAEMKGRLTSNGETVNFKEGMSREKAHEAVDRLFDAMGAPKAKAPAAPKADAATA